MAAVITKTPRAREDLLELAGYLARENIDVALRFLDAAESAFGLLAGMPELGTLCRFSSPQVASLRVWCIKGFQSYLIFYRPTNAGIDVVRVIHAARDIESLFSDTPEE